MEVTWIELTENTRPPCNELVWVERYSVGTNGVHHAVYLGARLEAPLSKNTDPSRDCYWFGRSFADVLYCDRRDGMKSTSEWADCTVKRWAPIKPPPLTKTKPTMKEKYNFSEALELLQKGYRVCRAGWNAKNQYVYHVPANSYPAVTEVAKAEFGEMVPYNAYLAIKTVQGTVAPWAPSQTDILAADWEIYEN